MSTLNLHIPTLMLALVLGFLMLTLELGISLKNVRTRPELRRWALGSWALLAGFGFLAVRPVVPLWLSIVVGNWLICVGIVLYGHALRRFMGHRPPERESYAIVAACLLAIATMPAWPIQQRTAVMSAIFAALLLPAVVSVFRHGWHAERSLRTVAVTLSMAIAALLVRAVHAWSNPQDYSDMMQASLGQGLTFLMAFICLMGAGFGFVLVVFERVANQLEELATHDGLTGCLNRSTTDAMLVHELQRGRRLGAPVSFVLLDLDHFKLINDRHGHRAGDAVLRHFAQTVRSLLRESDVLGRTGGEEFGLILPGTDLPGAVRLVEKVRQAMETKQAIGDRSQPIPATVSAGIAVALSDDEVAPEHLYGRADKALYSAKRAGRNRVEYYKGDGTSIFAPLS